MSFNNEANYLSYFRPKAKGISTGKTGDLGSVVVTAAFVDNGIHLLTAVYLCFGGIAELWERLAFSFGHREGYSESLIMVSLGCFC